MQITLDLPDSFSKFDKTELVNEMKLFYALIFFAQKKISMKEALELADVSEKIFYKIYSLHKISDIETKFEALQNDLVSIHQKYFKESLLSYNKQNSNSINEDEMNKIQTDFNNLQEKFDKIKSVMNKNSNLMKLVHSFEILENISNQSASDLDAKPNYDFSDIIGKIQFQEDPVQFQRSLRDEW